MALALKKQETTSNESADSVDLDPAKVREKAGLNVADMAALMAMSESGYSTWERGHRRAGGPAYQLLRLLNDDPKTVAAALRP